MLVAKYIQMEKYKEANNFLNKIPNTVVFFLEGKLMQAVTNVQSYLYKLIEMEEETGNHCKAEEIARKHHLLFALSEN